MCSAERYLEAIIPSLRDPLFQTWVEPLHGPYPCGKDLSFTDEFEALREEVEKSASLHGGRSTDWELVLRVATQILSSRSKDVWVLCYGAVAAYEARGGMACAAAISALNQLLEHHWDRLHPGRGRIRRRLAPLIWLAGRLEARIMAGVQADDPSFHPALGKEIATLQAVLSKRAAENAPSFATLLGRLGNPPQGAQVASPSSERSPGILASLPEVVGPEELLAAIDGDGRVPAAVLPRLLRSTQEQCRQLAVHFGSLDPLDWRVILLHRAALWCTVQQLPQADAAGVTNLRPVPPDKVRAYSAAVEAGRFNEILLQLENSAGKAPFWFDGHHLVARCLEGLGATAPLSVLCLILSRFLHLFPDLVRLKFQDGTPFVSARTLLWLDSLAAAGVPGASRVGARASEDAREQELLDESLAIHVEKGFQAGLTHLETVPVGRNRAAVRQGLLMARYCIAAGNKKAAIRLLQSLYAQLEKWELLEWEPELSAGIIALLISLQPKERGPATEGMLSRLHWLHLGMAVGGI